MQFIKPDINIDFIGKNKIAFSLSAVLIAVSLIALAYHKGPRYGIDFAGGTLVQVRFNDSVDTKTIKSGLAAVGMDKSSVQAVRRCRAPGNT